jgi:hypothetical protein
MAGISTSSDIDEPNGSFTIKHGEGIGRIGQSFIQCQPNVQLLSTIRTPQPIDSTPVRRT